MDELIGTKHGGWQVVHFAGTLKHGHKVYTCLHGCGFERNWRRGEILNNKMFCTKKNCQLVVQSEIEEELPLYLQQGPICGAEKNVMKDYKEKCLKIWAAPVDQEIDCKLLRVMLQQNVCDTTLIDQYKRKVFYGKDMDRQIVCDTTYKLEHLLSAGPTKCNDLYKPTKKSKIDLKQIHGLLGIIGESGELAKTLDKGLGQNGFTEDDKINLLEEFGDCLYYLTVAMHDMGFQLEDVLAKNVAKLEKRYGGSFSNEKAVNRDVEAEQEVLKA